ncbi:MAG: hypothetical protein K0R92_691 [Lachnospiraceae bacterium]|jgi:hypothetical protein|nr:hypothetical protein [Lachnospiraceae bacterium]
MERLKEREVKTMMNLIHEANQISIPLCKITSTINYNL